MKITGDKQRSVVVGVLGVVAAIAGCEQPGADLPATTQVVQAPLAASVVAPVKDASYRPHHYSGRSADGTSHGLAETSNDQHINAFGTPSFYPCQPSHVVLHGGQPMQGPNATSPVKIVPVIWGQTATFGFTKAQIDSFLLDAFGSPWWSWIRRQYHLANVVEAPWVTLTLTAANASKAIVSDTDIQVEIMSHLKDGTLPLYGGGSTVGSMMYLIHFPSTVSVAPAGDVNNQVCGGADGKHITTAGCAYNASYPNFTWTDGAQIKYIVMPDQTVGSCHTVCGNTTLAALDNMTMAESHELIEGMSDPWASDAGRSVHGWYDTKGCGQMGDMCNGWPVTTAGAGPTVVQEIWSNAGNRCEGNSPGAVGDFAGLGTSAIVLSGDPDPGTSATNVHIAQSGFGDLQFSALQPTDLPVFSDWITEEKSGKPLVADFTGDGVADIALTGTSILSAPDILPVAKSDGSGNLVFPGGGMTVADAWPEIRPIAGTDFPSLAMQTAFPPVAGDFNGDGFSDIALVGGLGWTTIPVALSTQNALGQFWGINQDDGGFNTYITNDSSTPQLVSADFNGDGLADLALVGLTQSPGVGFGFIALALAIPDSANNYRGSGTWVVRSYTTSAPAGGSPGDFNVWASSPGVKAVAGDFDGDGYGDIALAGGQGWSTIPVAFSRGGAAGQITFTVVNSGGGGNPSFAAAASAPGAQLMAGDFDGNGTWDLAVTGAPSSSAVGLALNDETPPTPGNMIWVSNSTNLATFTQQAAKVNVFATAPSRGGPLAIVIPPTPTGLSATAATGQMNLRWNASGGALTYSLFRSTASGGEAPIATSLTTTAFVDTGLPAGTKFFYKVGAVNLAGTSTLSSEVSATTPTNNPPPPTTTSLDCGGPATGAWIADKTTTGSTKTWTTAVNTSLLTGTIPPQAVLQSGRVGNLTYSFAGYAASSTHTVTVYFVENYWGAAGSRIFTVKANGTAKLTNFDIYAAAGAKFKAVMRSFTTTADGSGKLALTFVPSKDNASVEGIIVQ